MPLDAFRIWYEDTVVKAIRAGLTCCGTPADTGKRNAVAFEAAKKRARLEGMRVPPVLPVSVSVPKSVPINALKLAAACRHRAGVMPLFRIAHATGLDTSTLSPIFAAKRIALHRSTLENLCVWLGRKPVEFEQRP